MESQGSVTACLRDHGYRLFDAETPNGQRRPLDVAAWNTLAIPKGRRLVGAPS